MHKPKQIQINIPTPCNQPWEEMTPCGQGRFCNHCQKTVIDFTTWSDSALYEFFSKKTEKVCGRFLSTQTGRPIHIPPQPHSRLYRMTIALGLTLLFTQTTNVLGQNRPPRVTQNIAQNHTNSQPAQNGSELEIRGKVSGEDNVPLYHAIIYVRQAGIVKKEAKTDIDGRYVIQLSEPGNYDIIATYADYDSASRKLLFPPEDKATVNFSLYKKLSLDYNNPGRTVITGEDVLIEPQNSGRPKAIDNPEHRRKSRNHHRK